MEYEVKENTGETYQTAQVIFSEFDIDSEMSNIVIGVYSNGRGYVSCRTKKGHPVSIPIPFVEQGEWQYVEKPTDDPERLAQIE